MQNTFLFAILCALTLWATDVASANQIGVATSIKNQAQGILAGRQRTLRGGVRVFQRETIQTAADSAAQILFRDQTSLTMGANARIVLSKHVYDPERSLTQTVVRAVSGALRFVSGITLGKRNRLETPMSTIGIRGSILETYVDPGSRLEVHVLVQGVAQICLYGGQCVTLDTPGQFVMILPSGNLVGPRVWRGPLLDLDAGLNFVKHVRSQQLEAGDDVLPRTGRANQANRAHQASPRSSERDTPTSNPAVDSDVAN